MDATLRSSLASALGSEPVEARSVSGGDINEAYQVALEDGRRVFVKTHRNAPRTMFPAEARGLAWLADADALGVPEVLAVSSADGDGPAFLALHWLGGGPRAPDFEERLGRGLAALHRAGAPQFGADHDNFIGSLPQANDPMPDWATFYREQRLEPQLRRAVDAGLIRGRLQSQLDGLLGALPALVGPAEPPARLHGDLWGGNLHVHEGQPYLIDPAVYGGHREMDLAMMRLFGGFGERVFDAYREAYPLAPQWEQRIPLGQLYPLLVHVNLFGSGYVASVEDVVRRFLG